MKEHAEISTRGESGVVRVPLRPHDGRYATVDGADYERLLREGVRVPWFIVRAGKNEYVRAYCYGATGRQITVARAILGAAKRENVTYLTGDRTDLRRWNLDLVKGNGKRDDTGLCRAQAGSREAA